MQLKTVVMSTTFCAVAFVCLTVAVIVHLHGPELAAERYGDFAYFALWLALLSSIAGDSLRRGPKAARNRKINPQK